MDLVKEFKYNVSSEKVWQALTDRSKMRQCYFPQLLRFEPVVGYTFQFDDDSAEYKKEWVVTQVINGSILAHSWAYKGYPGKSEVVLPYLLMRLKLP